MTYHHLIDKLTACQVKILEHIESSDVASTLPPDLVEKTRQADAWLASANEKLGQAEVPELVGNIDPVMDYANAINLYQDMFDEKTRSEITKFNELTDLLFEETKGIAAR